MDFTVLDLILESRMAGNYIELKVYIIITTIHTRISDFIFHTQSAQKLVIYDHFNMTKF